jgi:hypothetical protein
MIGSKCLAVMDWPYGMSSNMDMSLLPPNFRAGVLDIHGAPRLRSWTKLAATAAAGYDTLVLSEDVDWGVGDHLVVATSEMDVAQSEEVVVEAVQGPRSLRLARPLMYVCWWGGGGG